MTGKVIAHFEVLGELGQGGMGTVYKARDQRLDRLVALKVLLPETVHDPERRRRFIQEAKAASALNHPNIVHIYEIDEADGVPFIAMEYVSGRTLEQIISPRNLPLGEVLRYAAQISDALATAHAAGIVHRDLKPTNIMVTDQGAVKLLDFGLAKLIERAETGDSADTRTLSPAAQLTAEGAVIGTAAYMSPEQAEGKPLDARSDIFSFGAVLYEMVTAQRAFQGPTRLSTLSAVLRDDPRPPGELRREIPGELERIITRCLRKDPDRRFQHVADLRVALHEVREESESAESVRAPAARSQTSRRWAVVAIVLAGGALATWRAGWLRPRATAPASVQPIQLTTSPGLAMGASLSPDGASLAFSSNRSGRFELYIRPTDPRGGDRQITSDGQQNIEPSWAPDGKTIVYRSVGRRGIWAIPAASATAAPRQVTPFGSRPVFSPDGSQIAFRSSAPDDLAWFDWGGTGESTIFTVGSDGSRLHQVTTARNPPGQHADPSWSPDGKRLIFASLGPMGARSSRNALWTVDVASGELHPVATGDLVGQASPVISPDGSTVYFGALTDGFGIYSVPLAGGAPPVALYSTGRQAPGWLAVSRDGRRLFCTLLIDVSQIWQTGEGASPARALYQDEVVRAKLPVYSPDGKRLAYLAQPQGANQDLWMMNADGSDSRSLSSEQGTANGPGWTSDSSTIWYSLFWPHGYQLRQIQVNNGTPQVLLDIKENLTRVHLTPDGREVLYDSGRPLNIWIRPLQGGTPRQLTFDREGAAFPNLSWDGQWIAYEVYRGDSVQLAVMDRNGGRQQVLTSEPGIHYSYSFASDNRRVSYTACPDGVWNVYWIDRISGETKQVTHYTAFGSVVRSPAWRPGTEQMAFELTEVKGNVYVMELPGSRR